MSILASLVNAYDRLPNAPPFGFSSEKIGFLISLNEDGTVANVTDLREGEGKKKQAPAMLVPQPVKRTAGISPNFLWDKTAYVLGITSGEAKRTAQEHAAFVQLHLSAFQGINDEGVNALRAFLQAWDSKKFNDLGWNEEIRDQNVAFALEKERLQNVMLHDRKVLREIWARRAPKDGVLDAVCLVTGQRDTISTLHHSIRNVWGAQSSGASLVSFNKDSFKSYGHDQGDNAPVSEIATFKYTTALNGFLERDSGHRVQIGDASTVFWADSDNAVAAGIAERWGAWMLDGASRFSDDKAATKEIEIKLNRIRRGEQLLQVEPNVAKGVRFYVLGLAPSAARLSVRFYFEDDFGVLTEHYVSYMQDMEFKPWPSDRPLPSISNCVMRTAPARLERGNKISFDRKQISPLLSGELFRAIISGNPFPGALLSLLIMRVRSDHILDSIRVALIKGTIIRAMRIEKRLPKRPDGTPMEDYLVRSDPDDPNPARRLGRLFAVIERAQLAALGDGINATVKDKFLGAAAATPLQVFVRILKNAQHHTQRLRNGHSDASWIKDAQHARRVGAGIERDIGLLWASFNDNLPVQHSSEEQGFFFVGYYQERFGGKPDPDLDVPGLDQGLISDGEE